MHMKDLDLWRIRCLCLLSLQMLYFNDRPTLYKRVPTHAHSENARLHTPLPQKRLYWCTVLHINIADRTHNLNSHCQCWPMIHFIVTSQVQTEKSWCVKRQKKNKNIWPMIHFIVTSQVQTEKSWCVKRQKKKKKKHLANDSFYSHITSPNGEELMC